MKQSHDSTYESPDSIARVRVRTEVHGQSQRTQIGRIRTSALTQFCEIERTTSLTLLSLITKS